MASVDEEPKEVPIKSALELWDRLRAAAGLTVAEKSEKAETYDDAFLAELRGSVLGDAKGDFRTLLETRGVSVERLLNGFFEALSPYPLMMTNILQMFEMARATHSTDNLRIAVTFDELKPPEELDLSQFREIVRRLETVTRLVRRRDWGGAAIWELQSRLMGDVSPGDLGTTLEDTELRAWFEAMGKAHRFPALPAAPVSGDARLDRVVEVVWRDFQDFHDAAREAVVSYDRIMGMPSKAEDYRGWAWKLLREAAHDFWPKWTVGSIARLSQELKRHPDDPVLLEKVTALEEFVTAITLPPEPVAVQIKELEELFRLPVWRLRHAFYSVWIAAETALALRPHGFTVLTSEDGVLAFPFKATLIGEVTTKDGKQLQLWAEVRTPAVKPIRRDEKGQLLQNIQPDYRLRIEGRDVALIECKQYKTSSTKNFSEALIDYARASGDAKVILTNYGPVSEQVSLALPAELAGRCTPIGHVRPQGAGRPTFRTAMDDAVSALLIERWRVEWVSVTLAWTKSNVDLDLHITTPEGACDYSALQGLREVIHHGDERGGPRTYYYEKAMIAPADSDRFDIVVRAYSGVTAPGLAGPRVSMRWRGEDGKTHDDEVFLDEAYTDWHVATVRRSDDRPKIVNDPAKGFETGRPWEGGR